VAVTFHLSRLLVLSVFSRSDSPDSPDLVAVTFHLEKHGCGTHTFCDMICSRDFGMILFAGMGKEPHQGAIFRIG
jgi:hypothetical protein